jgi:hypothetical protein
MFLKKIAITSLIAISSLSAFAGGYKDIQFGSDKASLEALGFEGCSRERYSCFNHKPDSKYTIFGKKVDLLRVDFDNNGLVNEIGLSGIPITPREFIALADKSIGKSTKQNYQSLAGATRTIVFWTLKDGSGITLHYGDGELDGRMQQALLVRGMVLNKTTSIDYVTVEALNKLKSKSAKAAKVDTKDF